MSQQTDNPIDRKARMQKEPRPARSRPAEERRNDFEETVSGYSLEDAIAEASRCLHCAKTPCRNACPLHNDIPRALALLEAGEIEAAAEVYRESSPMPEICGRVCPEGMCSAACTLSKMGKPVDTRHLEAFVVDYQRQHGEISLPVLPAASGKRVAVIGAGPAGLSVSEALVKKGHAVVVYDKYPQPGGLLLYGIPRFKLGKQVVADKVRWLEQLGVTFVCNTTVGKDISFEELRSTYDAVFIGIGMPVSLSPGLEGEHLQGVYGALEFLARAGISSDLLPEAWRAPLKVGPRVHVLGGGDTAMDCLRTALRLPGVTEVICHYRRSEAEMPAHARDYAYAQEEGAQFRWLSCAVRFEGDAQGRLQGVIYQAMTLGEPDESGRFCPVPLAGSEHSLVADTVVLAFGYRGDDAFNAHILGLETGRKGLILVDDEASGRTSLPGVFAAGDVVRGADLVAPAVAASMQVAEAIDLYLKGK